MFIQIIASNTNLLYLQCNLPRYLDLIRYSELHWKNKPYVEWFQENYDSGYIMISSLQHEPVMFYMKIPYKTYIHEGTQHYWIESIKNPQTYADWIFMYKSFITQGRNEDSTTKSLKDNRNVHIF